MEEVDPGALAAVLGGIALRVGQGVTRVLDLADAFTQLHLYGL